MKYLRKIVCVMLLFTFLGVASEVGMPQASAGNFETLAVTDFLQLGDDEKWEKSYNTSLGKFKIRFRKLLWSSDAKRYHLIIWWNDKRITDGYCPENGYGYAFRVFHDEATDRIFVVINSVGHAVMFGYDPINKKMEKFVDSNNYYNNGKYPYIKVDGDNDLLLGFLNKDGKETTKYKLFWDASANWFGYKDVTPRWTPPAPTVEYSAPSVSYNYVEPESEIYVYEDVVGS